MLVPSVLGNVFKNNITIPRMLAKAENKVHFKGLNELRALAAFAVIFSHIELYCLRDNNVSLFNVAPLTYFMNHLGHNGVYLFFVLSGFLITYLLMKETDKNGHINIRNFYLRRVFRIWPVYYLVMFISFLILPLLIRYTGFFASESYFTNLINKGYTTGTICMYLFFLSNFAPPVVGMSQSWSVSVEEQFYLIWPNLINFINKKLIPYSLVGIIVIYQLILRLKIRHLLYISENVPIDFMAWGGLFACLKLRNNAILSLFKSNLLFAIFLLILIPCFFIPIPLLLYGVLFGILIMFVTTERSFNLQNGFLDKMGKVSYGLYMYHPIMMLLSSAVAHNLGLIEIPYKIAFYVLVVLSSILASHLSYKFMENKLIKLKDRKYSV
jgi:peptidoglycan/LPS O-acetylase OafA/YrhL